VVPGHVEFDHAGHKFTCIDKLMQIGGYPVCIYEISAFVFVRNDIS
jgi:hypothetical protein